MVARATSPGTVPGSNPRQFFLKLSRARRIPAGSASGHSWGFKKDRDSFPFDLGPLTLQLHQFGRQECRGFIFFASAAPILDFEIGDFSKSRPRPRNRKTGW
jgi:hypothetical protein